MSRRARAAAGRQGGEPTASREDWEGWIEDILRRFAEVGLVSDARYGRQLAASLRQRGLGARAITARLRQRGVPEAEAREAVEQAGGQGPQAELSAATRLVQRRRLGPYRPPEEREKHRQRDLAALARAGFAWDIAVRALEQ